VSTRRFIAGAVCPACGAVDRTVVEGSDDARQRICVACGHREQQAAAGPVPGGRFEKAPATADNRERAVKLMTPPAKADD
jgi:uncharacterized metal-binding protein (TIGR02443 family)